LLVASTALAGRAAMARPTQQDLDNAKVELASLNQHLSLLVEQYDVATIKLRDTEQRLADTRARAAELGAEANAAREELSQRAALAYTGATSSLEVLLGAQSYDDLAARVEFLSTLVQEDADLAQRADLKRRQSQRAKEDLSQAVKERSALVDQLATKKAEILASIVDQQALINSIEGDLAAQAREAAVRAAAEAAVRAAAAASHPGGGGSNGGGGGTGGGGGSGGGGGPPPPSSLADIAVAAAYDAIGVPYVWGGGSPEEGFDCSGLTMWSWAQAGVSLPHSSQMQYDVLPHVSRDQIQPGDLLFFYQPISHVAIYVGNNQMIHATHPGELSHLETIADYWWAEYVGAGRPG